MFGWTLTAIMVGCGVIIFIAIRHSRISPEEKVWIKEVRENGMKVKNETGTKEVFVKHEDDDYAEEEPMNQEGIDRVEEEKEAIKRRRRHQ